MYCVITGETFISFPGDSLENRQVCPYNCDECLTYREAQLAVFPEDECDFYD